jgi:hypothetical protein
LCLVPSVSMMCCTPRVETTNDTCRAARRA